MWWFLVAIAAGVEGFDGEPVELVRVDDPGHPDAVAATEHHALLLEPPAGDVDWHWETMAVPDGVPGQLSLDALNADLWHAEGWRGQGVRMAVFDIQWNGATLDPAELGDVQTHDCWQHPSCEVAMDPAAARFVYETGVHGSACAEVVRTVAPDAELHLVRVNGYTTFASAADWAIRNDVDVVSMSMSFFNDSFYDGTGPFADVVRRMEAAGVLLVASAGNYAEGHWSGKVIDADGDGRVDFDGDNGLDVWLNAGRRTVYVAWDEHFSCGTSDLDAHALDRDGWLVGRAERRQGDGSGCSPVERLSVTVAADGVHRIEVPIRRSTSAFLDLDVLVPSGTVLRGVEGTSIADPGSVPLTFTVGAVRAERYLDAPAEAFSSRGPVRSGAPKPDIAGPNGLSTDPYGAKAFFGTSASTPAVAGAVALVMSRYPELTPREAATRLQGWAWGDDPGRDDPALGAGKARLPVPFVDDDPGCGRRPLWAGFLVVLPAAWRRRRR